MTESRRDARSERPLSNNLDDVTFNGDGRTDRASLQDSFCFDGDGRPPTRHSRASLQDSFCFDGDVGLCVPIKGYSSPLTTNL